MEDQLQSERCARILRAIADPERLKIIQCLQSGTKNVGALVDLLQDTTMANVSHHLGVLRHAGLVCVEKQGKYALYSLSPDILKNNNILELGCCRLHLGQPQAPAAK